MGGSSSPVISSAIKPAGASTLQPLSPEHGALEDEGPLLSVTDDVQRSKDRWNGIKMSLLANFSKKLRSQLRAEREKRVALELEMVKMELSYVTEARDREQYLTREFVVQLRHEVLPLSL